jgi:predicted DNA-binding ribbon-helix-helix protein
MRSAIYTTLWLMGAAPPPLSLRLGRDGFDALEQIARRRGISRAEAARQAISETAERDRRRTGLASEARRLMEDPAYLLEAREVASLAQSASC